MSTGPSQSGTSAGPVTETSETVEPEANPEPGFAAAEKPGRSGFRRLWPVVRFILGIGVAALVVWVLSSHTDELSGASAIFDHLRWAWLIPAVVAEGASYLSLARVQRRLLATGPGTEAQRAVP